MRTILYLNAVGEISGAERSLLVMLTALDRERWRPVLAAPDGPLLDAAATLGVATWPVALAPLHRPHTFASGWAALQDLRRGWRAIGAVVRAIQPDLLHANTTPAMLYALRARVPRVWHVRDLTPLGRISGLLYREAAAVAAIAQAVADDLLPYADDGGAKIALVPPAVDTAHFRPPDDHAAARAALGLPADAPLIGLIAQFVPWKRHGLFLDALERLTDQPWHAVLAGAELHGEDDYVAALRARISAPPLARRVAWLSWQADAAPLLGALDVLALTSAREPFGRVLIEAMACAVPVVAVAEGGPAEIVRHDHTGLLVPADPDALAAALAALLADPTRRTAMGAAGRANIAAHYSLDRQRDALTAVYERIIGSAS